MSRANLEGVFCPRGEEHICAPPAAAPAPLCLGSPGSSSITRDHRRNTADGLVANTRAITARFVPWRAESRCHQAQRLTYRVCQDLVPPHPGPRSAPFHTPFLPHSVDF